MPLRSARLILRQILGSIKVKRSSEQSFCEWKQLFSLLSYIFSGEAELVLKSPAVKLEVD